MSSSQLAAALADCQRPFATRGGAAKALSKLLSGDPGLLDEFLQHLDRALVISKKEPSVDRFIQTVSKALSTTDEQTLAKVVRHVLARSQCTDKTVRHRACQCVSSIISNLDAEHELDEALYNELIEVMLPRLLDRVAAIRQDAIPTLGRLQDINDPRDPITASLLELMDSDSTAEVRKAALQNIIVNRTTLKHILERVADVNASVRAAALTVLAQKVDHRYLSVQQRLEVLERGLKDRETVVVEAAQAMLVKHWLAVYSFDMTRLLTQLIDEDNDDTAFVAARAIVDCYQNADRPDASKVLNDDFRRLIKSSLDCAEIVWSGESEDEAAGEFNLELSREALIILAARLETIDTLTLPEDEKAARKEALLPDLAQYCQALNGLLGLESDQSYDMLRWLLFLFRHMDAADEGGCRAVAEVLLKFVQADQAPEDIIHTALHIYAQVTKDLRQVASTLAQLVRDLWTEEVLEADDEDLIYDRLRALLITSFILTKSSLLDGSEELNSLVELAFNALQIPVAGLRQVATRCLSTYSATSVEAANKFKCLLSRIASNDLEEPAIRSEAVQGLADVLLRFDNVMDEHGKLAAGSDHVPSLFARLLSSHHQALACVAAEGCAKLLLNGRLEDEQLFGTLLYMYILNNPDDAEDSSEENEMDEDTETQLGSYVRLQQFLSLFFPTFMASHRAAQPLLAGSISTTLHAFTSKASGHESRLPISHGIKYIKSLAATSTVDAEHASAADTNAVLEQKLVLCICRELLRAEGYASGNLLQREYAKNLATLSPADAGCSDEAISALRGIVVAVAKSSHCDKMALRSIAKFVEACGALAQISNEKRAELVAQWLSELPDLAVLLDFESVDLDDELEVPTADSRTIVRPTTKRAPVKRRSNDGSEDGEAETETAEEAVSRTVKRKAVPARRAAAQKTYKEIDSDDDNDAEGDTPSPEDETVKKPISRTKRDVLKENKTVNSAATRTSETIAGKVRPVRARGEHRSPDTVRTEL